MPTPTRRALRRARRLSAVFWWAGALAWAALIFGTQRPWAGPDEFQQTQWLLVGLGGILVGTLQRRGKDYWPANALLGLACGAPPVMYLGLSYLAFAGDSEAFRQWAGAVRLGLWAWGACLALLAWALYLVLRVNRAREGSSMDIWGRPRTPSEEQVAEALHVVRRAVRHQVGNLFARAEFRALAEQLIEAREAVWFRDPEAQLQFERERAARRIAAAEARLAEARERGN